MGQRDTWWDAHHQGGHWWLRCSWEWRNMKSIDEIKKELKRKKRILKSMENNPECPESSRCFMEATISALEWVLERNSD